MDFYLSRSQKKRLIDFNNNNNEKILRLLIKPENMSMSKLYKWVVKIPKEYINGHYIEIKRNSEVHGGFLPIIPVLAGIAAVAGIVGNIAKPIIEHKKAQQEIGLLKDHYSNIEKEYIKKNIQPHDSQTPGFLDQVNVDIDKIKGGGLNEGWDHEYVKEKKTIKYFNNNQEIFNRLLKIKAEEDAGNTDVFNEEKYSILECLKNSTTTNTEFLLDFCTMISQYQSKIVNNMLIEPKTGSGIVNNIINKLPVELHVPGYQYLGPGTYFDTKYVKNHKPKNDLDKAAYEHDLKYSQTTKSENPEQYKKNIAERHVADEILKNSALKILKNPKAGVEQRFTAGLTAGLMKLKTMTGSGTFTFEQTLPKNRQNMF